MTKILTVNELNVYVHKVVKILAPDHKRGPYPAGNIERSVYGERNNILQIFKSQRTHTHPAN